MSKFYQWSAPLIQEGDKDIEFIDWCDKHRFGECENVNTTYGRDGIARHHYRFRVDGLTRRFQVSQERIILHTAPPARVACVEERGEYRTERTEEAGG